MRKIVVTLVGAAFALLNVAGACAATDTQNHPIFFGDGFDNTTCADMA